MAPHQEASTKSHARLKPLTWTVGTPSLPSPRMMRNLSRSPSVMISRTRKLAACGMATALLLSACGAAPTAGISPSSKIAPAVATAVSRLEAGRPLDGRLARSDQDGKLEVYVYVTDMSPASLETLTERGLQAATPSPAMNLVQGWIAPRNVSALASLSVVTRITLPSYASHY